MTDECHQPAANKNVAKRPGANKGVREEENRPGISLKAKRLKRLRNNETFLRDVCAADKLVIAMQPLKFHFAGGEAG
jgi:hypothetical protein